jgi:hypothetical protein
MADDKSQRGESNRSKVAAVEQYGIEYFAEKHGISIDEAKKILQDAGSSHFRADAAAAYLKNHR